MNARERLQAAVKQLQDFSDDLDKKDALTGEDITELKRRMDEVKDLRDGVEADAKAKGEMADAKAFLASLSGPESPKESISVRATTEWGATAQPQGKTLGEMFVESGAYKDFLGRYAKAGVIPMQMKGIQSEPAQFDLKTLVTGASSTSAGAYVQNDRYGPTTDLVGDRELTIADIVTRGNTGSDTVEYVRVTGKTNNAAQVAEATTAAAPTAPGTAGALVQAAGGGYKPESGLALEVVSAAVKTTAHWIPMTKRAASDAGQVRTLVDNFLRVGLDEKLEDGILNGDGTGENFTGILATSGIQTVGSAGTDIDAVVDAIAAIRTTGRRRPTAIVAHPNDWYSTGFLTAKDTQGNYILGDPRATIDQLNTLWGLRVVVSEAMTQNTLLVGDFRQAVLWNREGVSVMVSDQHADFFVRNLLAILAERRDAFGILDPQGFCTVTAV